MQSRQWRVVALGDWNGYLSHFLLGVQEGAVRCGAWFRGIQLVGQDVSAMEQQLDFVKPHLILAHMIFNKNQIPMEQVHALLQRTKKKHGTTIAYHAGDARVIPRYPHPINHIVDLALVNHLMLKEFGDIWKVPCYHWPYPCLYQKDIGPLDKRYVCDLAFTGALAEAEHIHHGPRSAFLERLARAGLKASIFPNEWSGNTRMQTAELSASAKGVLGVQMGTDLPGYQDVRPFQYIGAGAVYFHDNAEQMRLFFEPYKHYVEYDRGDEHNFKAMWNKYQDSQKIRKEGFKLCQQWHSAEARMQFVFDLLNGKVNKPRIYLEDVE